jgi:phosphoribosyl 1,2-cyclic phosphodiesterase
VELLFCGVRGSTPAPGADFVRVGGHTSCVALTPVGGARPTLVLDAGTGLQRLTEALGDEPFRGALLLSHLHWDHVQGLPFFRAGDRPDAEVRLLLPDQGDGQAAVEVLAGQMSPPHFPIRPEGLQGSWSFGTVDVGTHEIEGFTVTAAEIPHKGGRTFGYRVTEGDRTLVYASDHGPLGVGPGPDGHGPVHESILGLAKGADVLVHDAQFVAAELAVAESYGHATVDYCFRLAHDAGVSRLVLFHHAPTRVDDDVEAFEKDPPAGLDVVVAREGEVLRV